MKYVGSKARIFKHYTAYIQPTIKKYYVEPFVGGCNTLQYLNLKNVTVILNDKNTYLISMWKALLQNWKPPLITKEQYHDIKNNMNKYPPELIGWVGVNCSYSGKWFAGYAGKSKTKQGLRNYQKEALVHVQKQVDFLKTLKIMWLCDDYQNLDIPNKAAIYCDPPYANTLPYLETFNTKNYWKWVGQYKNIFCSEYTAPKNFKCLVAVPHKSSLSANGKIGGNKNTIEKLFTPYLAIERLKNE